LRILFDAGRGAGIPAVDINEVLLRGARRLTVCHRVVHLIVVDEGWPGVAVRAELIETGSAARGAPIPCWNLMCTAAGTPVPGVRAVVEGRGEYTTGRGPRPPFRWSLTAGPRGTGHRGRVLQYGAHPRWRISS